MSTSDADLALEPNVEITPSAQEYLRGLLSKQDNVSGIRTVSYTHLTLPTTSRV